MGRSRSRSRSKDRMRRSRSRERKRARSRSKDRDYRRRRERSRSRDRRRERSSERRRNRSRSREAASALKGREKSREQTPSKASSQGTSAATHGAPGPAANGSTADDKRQQRLAKLAAWKKKQEEEQVGDAADQAAAPPAATGDHPACNDSVPPASGWHNQPAPTPSALVGAVTQPPNAVEGQQHLPHIPPQAAPPIAQQQQQGVPAKLHVAPAAQPAEGLLNEEEDEVDPLDAFMAAEVMPEVKAKEAEEQQKREEERRLLHDLIQKGKVPKILEVDSEDEEPEADVEIQIPAHKVKLVVGAGGEKIKWIQRKSKCRIQVKKDEKDLNKAFGSGPEFNLSGKGPQKEGDKVKMSTLQLFGSAEQCEQARVLIEEAVDNREQKQKQRQKEYEKKKDVKWRERQIYHMRHARDYETLGLPLGSSKADIKQAFRKLALKWHPDKNRDRLEEAEKMFQEISRSYESLMTTDEDAKVEQIGMP